MFARKPEPKKIQRGRSHSSLLDDAHYRSVPTEEDDQSLEEYATWEAVPPGMDEELFNVKVAAGKAFGILDKRDSMQISVERSSVYGAALVLPQFARTAGWSLSFTTLSIRSYLLLFANVWLQGFLLYMVSKEERIMDKFSGQPRLCDFGAHLSDCPVGPNCLGPGGTPFTPDRLYHWSLWSTRRFVRDAFIALFPERTEEIHQLIDPGEYGVESYNLRIVSVYLFVLGLWGDLASSFEVCALLWEVPTAPEPWMCYVIPNPKDKRERGEGWSELDHLRFSIAGMPSMWKWVNLLVVGFPKFYLWILTVDIGVVFLMETSKIEDMIINSVALAFILSIDELIFSSLMPTMSKHMMEQLDDYSCQDDEAETFWQKDALDKHYEDLNWNIVSLSFYTRIVPYRLLSIAFIAAFFILKYYVENCRRTPDGSLVAKDVYYPKSDILSFWSFMLGPIPSLFPLAVEETDPVWSMQYPAPNTIFSFRRGPR